MHDLFLSYSRRDLPKIEVLASMLERIGWTIWWDRRIIVGQAFDKVIERALEEARIVIVAWSEHSVDSDWVRAEASFAVEQNKLVPIALDHAPWPVRFRTTHTLDLTDWDGTKDHIACTRLIADLQERLGPPGDPKPAGERAARSDLAASFGGARVIGANAGAMALPLGRGSARAPGLGAGAWAGIGVAAVLALLVGAHIAYPRPLLSAFGANTAAIQQDVARKLMPLRCATITPTVTQDWMFQVKVQLAGYVSANDDVAAATDLAKVQNVSSVANALTVLPWPFCDAVNIADTVAPPGSGLTPPQIRSDSPDMVFKDGDRLVLNVTSASIDGYLYVDYVDDGGTVAHMLPNKHDANNDLRAGQDITVGAAAGDKSGEPAYEVGAPYGKRMILATTSRAPLFDKPRDQVENAATYLGALRQSLAKVRGDDPASAVMSYRFITTEAAKE
ncbi:MAG TPA: TIR domain-containing protein [Stellaceae bacterium]|nr:TIR domain-containing protein [Stellaceae bacterium]